MKKKKKGGALSRADDDLSADGSASNKLASKRADVVAWGQTRRGEGRGGQEGEGALRRPAKRKEQNPSGKSRPPQAVQGGGLKASADRCSPTSK